MFRGYKRRFMCQNLQRSRHCVRVITPVISCPPGLRGVWEQLHLTSVRAAGTPGLLEHQSLPAQVLRPGLSGQMLLQPLPHWHGAGGVPLPPRSTHPASGDGDRVVLLQPRMLPHAAAHVPAVLGQVLRNVCRCGDRQVLSEGNDPNLYSVAKSTDGRADWCQC